MASPRSVRLSDDALHRLTELAGRTGSSISSTMERLLEEALRREAHPGITFRDGPSGRRAGLVAGPDVDEVIRALRSVQRETSEDVLAAMTEATGLTEDQIRSAVAYYADHGAEVDTRIVANERAAEEAESAWRRQQEILTGPAR